MSNPFGHDPEASREIESSAPTSFDEAKGAVEESPGADGLGFVVNRHDPFLVLEIANAVKNGELLDSAERILNSLGMTFTEEADDNVYRAIYRGELPGDLHGGEPVVVTISDEVRNFALRFYDSGWTPLTGRHISGTPDNCREVDEDALKRLLSKTGHYDE